MPCKCLGAVDVTIFRQPDSAEGLEAKRFFNRKGVAYEDVDVATNPQGLQRMLELSGQVERPVILVDDRVVIGFNLVELEPLVPSFF